MTSFIEILYCWQDLIGAFIGPFLAVILSGITFLCGKKYNKYQKENDAMRNIEISVSYALNNILNIQLKLQLFVKEVRKLIKEIQDITDPRAFALQTRNFPAIGTIYVDDDMLKMPTKSYYMHNKLLWIHSGTKDVNNVLNLLREDFSNLTSLNQKLLDLMKDHPNPIAQRNSYIENLTIFTNEIERFSKIELVKGVTPLIQVKIYNNKLRKGWYQGSITRWENEGTNSWFIRKIFGFNSPKRFLENIDFIDSKLEKEVDIELDKLKKRAEKTNLDNIL